MSVEGDGVSLPEAALGADLGGSSKHSAEIFSVRWLRALWRRVPRQLHLYEG